MANTDQPNAAQQVGGFAVDAGADTAVDGAINNVVDGIASHIPGANSFESVLNTGVDLQVNNALNTEISNLEGEFGHKTS